VDRQQQRASWKEEGMSDDHSAADHRELEEYHGSQPVHDQALMRGEHEGPVPDPGLPPHEPRPTDVDPDLERRAERQVAGMFILAALLIIGFTVSYFAFKPGPGGDTVGNWEASNLFLGLCLGLALLLIGAGLIQWARKLMGDHEIVEYRHSAGSTPEDKEETLAAFYQGTEESGFTRRKLVRNSLLTSLGLLGIPAIVMLRDLGPLPGSKPAYTVWTKGMHVVFDVTGLKIKASDMEIGTLVNAEPEVFFEHEDANGNVVPGLEGVELQNAKAKAAVILVRMQPDDITPSHQAENWGIDGILCFSKICTHVGCPISLWEQQTHSVLCPCHQSTFDLADNAKVIFGPAARPLPQLPIELDEEGYIVAQSGFTEPVGPSYWERG
jgi:ubiquinol-cytochrome c reductase iron-sulfur subunit